MRYSRGQYRINISSCFSMDHKKTVYISKRLKPPYYFPATGRRFERAELLGRGVPETNETMRTSIRTYCSGVIHRGFGRFGYCSPNPAIQDSAFGIRKKMSITLTFVLVQSEVWSSGRGTHFNSLPCSLHSTAHLDAAFP